MVFPAYIIAGLVLLVLHVTVGNSLSISEIQPNLLLFTVVYFGLRVANPWVFLFAAFLGLGQDVFSHGILGVNAIAFTLVYYLARGVRHGVYANTVLLAALLVVGLCLVGGLFATALLHMLDDSIPWWNWVFTRVLPEALYTGLLTPIPFLFWHRLERWFAVEEA